MTDLATLRAMLTRQIENRESRVSRRQRRADVREKNRGFRHPAGDYQIAREEGLLRELLAIYDGLNAQAERAERAEKKLSDLLAGLREFANACKDYEAQAGSADDELLSTASDRIDLAAARFDALIEAAEAP